MTPGAHAFDTPTRGPAVPDPLAQAAPREPVDTPHDTSRDTSHEAPHVHVASLDDLATVVELRIALLREYGAHRLYGRLRPDAERRAFASYRVQLQSPDQIILLAERGGGADVVGILRCVDALGSPLLYPDRHAYISSVYVRPAHRRTGVLRALFVEARTWCLARGLTEMRLHNSSSNAAAIESWHALGFDVVEQVRTLRIGE